MAEARPPGPAPTTIHFFVFGDKFDISEALIVKLGLTRSKAPFIET
jgi:hypothetical protein